MNILHTSDWHLGKMLEKQKRYEEFSLFLDWLLEIIVHHEIDILLISGDIFDTTTPNNQSQKLYYNFLSRLSQTPCHHTVIIGGNHDSPTFINAPKSLLESFQVHVVGVKGETEAEEVITLFHEGVPEAIVCAVPYLRDRDIRSVEAGESVDEKNMKMVEGLKAHYEEVCSLAEEKRSYLMQQGYPSVPILGMGHLFVAGGITVEGDGVRELSVGGLNQLGTDMFPPAFDYLALGHLHVPQKVGGKEHIRYSGSPIPMGFGEAKQQKIVIKVSFDGLKSTLEELPVPRFQDLVRISGSLEEITQAIERLKKEQSKAYLEIESTGLEGSVSLREHIDTLLDDSFMTLIALKNKRVRDLALASMKEPESLEELSTREVFTRCLQLNEIPLDQQKQFLASFDEIVQTLHEHDSLADEKGKL